MVLKLATTAHQLERPISVLRVRYDTVDALVNAYGTDLSTGGMFVEADELVPAGSAAALELQLPPPGGKISIACRVVYTRDAARAELTGKPKGMGVQFLDLTEADLARIGRFIADNSIDPAESTRRLRAKPLKVLVVDDDATSRSSAAQPFVERGDEVSTACDGVAALAACLRAPPDVIVADVQMPRMDGWQLVRVVRSRADLAQVPVLFLTTLRGDEDRLRGYRLGVDDFVPKPLRPEELTARVDRLLARGRPGSDSRTMISGDLQQVALPSVLGFLEMERRTGILTVECGTTARIHIAEGTPRKVELDTAVRGRSSRDALKDLLRWQRGRFEFTLAPVTCDDEVRASLTSLLIDAAREADEAEQLDEGWS